MLQYNNTHVFAARVHIMRISCYNRHIMKASVHRMGTCKLSPAQQLEHCTMLLILQTALLWFFAMNAYAGKFMFWKYAVSYLGAVRTVNDLDNTPSRIWFVLSMLISACFMLRMAAICREQQIVNGNIYRVLYTLGSIGSLIICCPKDISQPVHATGAGLLVFSHVMLSLTRITVQSRLLKTRSMVIRLLILLIPVLAYAYCWVMWIETVVQLIQKFAFAALFYVGIITSKESLVSREEKLLFFSPSPGDRILGSS